MTEYVVVDDDMEAMVAVVMKAIQAYFFLLLLQLNLPYPLTPRDSHSRTVCYTL